MDQIRLNKFLAERLGLSRREADDAIAAGAVSVSGKPAVLGQRIDKSCEVCYNGKIVPFSVEYLYLGLNKPVGYVCSRRRQGDFPTIYELLPPEFRELKTVGRLDRDSSGLILLTNDGDFAFRMTHPRFAKEKIYEVALDQPLAPLHRQMIADFGIQLPDGPSRLGLTPLDNPEPPAAATPAPRHAGNAEMPAPQPGTRWQVTMSEGRNRQIRRTFAALGYEVVALHRISFGPYRLSDLPEGQYTKVPKL